ncbi:MAG: PQQ-binding-like beta-propeller repeat protein, partial [Campylobacteraceae bacterium]|nr:PQQ-binding-like beta-propeller repeat protein [Campylobacteraceae bacterium]
MIRSLIALGCVVILFTGCGTKRQYFEPESVAGKVKYDQNLPAQIVDVSRHGATLENGQIITQKGIIETRLPKGFVFLGEYGDRYIATSKCGDIIIIDGSGNKIYSRTFKQGIASASLQENVLAIVDRSNQLLLLDTQKDEIYFQSRQDTVYALDARIAAPYFLNSLVVFPTLDGKVVVVDKDTGRIIRDVVVSSEQFFNNVIFLDVVDDRMVVATSKRVISINPNMTAFLDVDVKDVIVLKERVFVFTKDGRVLLTDSDLNILKERKFSFAVFSGVIHGEFIYMVEKNGFLIATDLDLRTVNIYGLPSKIDTMVYATHDTLFVG